MSKLLQWKTWYVQKPQVEIQEIFKAKFQIIQGPLLESFAEAFSKLFIIISQLFHESAVIFIWKIAQEKALQKSSTFKH